MNAEEIDITGVDKVKLLLELVHGTRPIGVGVIVAMRLRASGIGFNEQLALELLETGKREDGSFRLDLDYVQGRPIKVTLMETKLIHAWLYDRDAGEGACQRAVDKARGT